VLAHAAVKIVTEAGRACKGPVLGLFASKNDAGQLSTKRVSELTASSKSQVNSCRALSNESMPKQFSTYTDLGKKAGCARRVCSEIEADATRRWMEKMNPARSGDKFTVCWMVESLSNFYDGRYRSVEGQSTIIEFALASDKGSLLRKAAKNPTNRWLRNVKVYLDATDQDQLHKLRVKELCSDRKALDAELLARLLCEVDRREAVGVRDFPREGEEEEEEEEEEDKEEDEEDEEEEKELVLCPRTKVTFYKVLLKGSRLWKRPPHDHCTSTP